MFIIYIKFEFKITDHIFQKKHCSAEGDLVYIITLFSILVYIYKECIQVCITNIIR